VTAPVTGPCRIVFLPALHPDDPGEEFFKAEIEAIRARRPVLVVPLRPQARREEPGLVATGLLSRVVLAACLRSLRRAPLRTARAAAFALDPRRPLKSLRQLLVVPKAVWIASLVRNGDVVVAGWLTTTATAAGVIGRLTGVPWIAMAHRRDILEAASVARKVREAASVRAISEASRRSLVERLGPVASIQVVHLGIAMPDELAPPAPRTHILAIGHLIPLKNHETLVRALAHPDAATARLTIAGGGPGGTSLRGLADELGVGDRLVIEGHVPHEELLGRMAAGEWGLVTSASTTEGIPVSLMEALGLGLPVVASDVGGVAELVAPAGGELVPDPDDHDAFALAWSRIGAAWADPDARRARRFVEEQFSVAAVIEQLLGLVERSGPS